MDMAIHRGEPPPTTGQRLSKALRLTVRSCSDCGFEDTILAGEWTVRTGQDPRTGHVVFHLECPDCTGAERVEMNIP